MLLSNETGRRFDKRRPVASPGGAERAQAGGALRVTGISKWYGGVRALAEVTMSVDRGEVVALVGDNGAGKSTLVNVLAGVIPPDEGEIHVDGERVAIRSTDDAALLGIRTVHQEQTLADNLDVVENLYLGRELSRGRGPLRRLDFATMERRTWRALADLGISTITDVRAPVAQLSGGQRRSIVVARVLLEQYPIVLLDEPTAGLGVVECGRVMDLVRRLRAQNAAVLIVSQNIDEIFGVADRIVVLHLGRVSAVLRTSETTPEAVFGAVMGIA